MTVPADEKPSDDLVAIPSTSILWRRVPAVGWSKPEGGAWRIESGYFDNSSDGSGMSVHREAVAVAEALTLEDLLSSVDDPATVGVVALLAGNLRDLRQGIIPEPLLDDLTHAEVVGTKNSKTRQKIRNACEVVRVPPCLLRD